MLVSSRNVSIPVGSNGQKTSGLILVPAQRKTRTTVIVAHGAGNDMYSPLLTAFAEGLSHAGYPTVRFNFLYREHGKRMPDREETLSQTWRAAYDFAKSCPDLQSDMVVAAGKSLGGRIASQMVADGSLPVDRLVFLGYPLHAPGRKDKLRDWHIYRVKVPMLFFVGTRDPLCDVDRLKTVLGRLHADWDFLMIEGGDHSFRVPKSVGMEAEEVNRRIVEKTLEWLDAPPPFAG